MKYQVGDDILVLHSNEEGKVIEIINDTMVMIEVRGVRFPAYMDQIDFPYFKRFTEKKIVPDKKIPKQFIDQVPKEKPRPNEIRVADGVWLSLIPKFGIDDFNDEIVELLKVYLVNHTNVDYQFKYQQLFLGEESFVFANTILPFQDFYLHDIPFEAVNDSPVFQFEFSLSNPVKRKATHFETQLKLKPKQLFQKIEALKENNEPTVSYLLFDQYPDEVVSEKMDLEKLAARGYKVYDAGRIREHLEPARSLVDLHIEKLVNDWEHLDNFEILSLQLKEFEKWLELAIMHRMSSFIVIHGVGTGKLRDEIHDLLKLRKEVKHFINQYDSRYGYGATAIYLQYP